VVGYRWSERRGEWVELIESGKVEAAVRAGDLAGTQKGLPDAPAIINTKHNPRYD